jgi:chemotaxis protein methyltransferase CheR
MMPLSQVEFDAVRRLVQERSAIVLDSDKLYLAETRLQPIAQDEGFESVSALVCGLGNRSALAEKVVEAMTTNETSFFRDAQPFEALRREVIPDLVRRRGGERELHIWSAACSSGQEPYSILLLLREHHCLPPGWRVNLLATDFSNAVLERARAGRYGQAEINRGLPVTMLVKYFTRHGLEWQLQEDMRRLVRFLRLNLIETWPTLPQMDVVFMRNVLMYFDVPTRKKIFAKLRRVLRPDGYLFLGGAESTFNVDDAFERLPLERAGCYRLRQS